MVSSSDPDNIDSVGQHIVHFMGLHKVGHILHFMELYKAGNILNFMGLYKVGNIFRKESFTF